MGKTMSGVRFRRRLFFVAIRGLGPRNVLLALRSRAQTVGCACVGSLLPAPNTPFWAARSLNLAPPLSIKTDIIISHHGK